MNVLFALVVVATGWLNAAAVRADPGEAFPRAEAASVGMDPAALESLGSVVRGFVERDEIVGAEVMVIKNRRLVYDEGFGFRDREEHEPMGTGGIFCIRSMTKTFVGTAIQMLIDDGKLSLDDTAAKWLPSFDNDKSRAITVRQLLTHTSGLALSELLGHSFDEFGSVRALADISGRSGPEHPVGEFHYSDQGADTLTAIIEAVTGAPAERFIETRVIDALGMTDTVCVLKKDDPRRTRACSLYLGTRGAWSRAARPSETGGIFPFFLGSQGMYSTPMDYARLLAIWSDGAGRGGGEGGARLMSQNAIRRGLTPVSPRVLQETNLAALSLWYAQLWMVYVNQMLGGDGMPTMGDVVAFGHNGSDGTYAWSFPGRDLMVLYFTQSRGQTTGPMFERGIQKILLDGDVTWRPERDEQAAGAGGAMKLDDYTGFFEPEDGGPYRVFYVHDGKLTIDIPAEYCGPLSPDPEKDCFALDAAPAVKVRFNRDEAGRVVAAKLARGPNENVWVRFTPPPPPALPSIDEVVKAYMAAHHSEALTRMKTLKLTGTIDIPARKLSGKVVARYRFPSFARIDVDYGARQETTVIRQGRMWRAAAGQPVREAVGGEREHAILMMPWALYGDWRESIPELTVVRRAEFDGKHLLSVRAVPKEAFPSRRLIDLSTGLLASVDTSLMLPGLGTVGVGTSFSDFREVGASGGEPGAKLPFKTEVEFSAPMLGTVTTKFEAAEPGVELGDELFEEPKPKSNKPTSE
ncbi:MAG TPA: serine hydrolase domain-containing protein [Phycisphaerales bacterium]|nr:serine hydrolase domain-containing protein [Phycisphaerales bacterium]